MENNELKNRILKNVKEDIAISAIRKELNMEKVRKQKKIYGIFAGEISCTDAISEPIAKPMWKPK